MRYFWLSMVLLAGLSSCKLMPRNDPSEKDKKLSMNGPFVTPEWAKQTSIYEVNLRQYTAAGTFNAFAAELPRLKELGVETLWFMPLTPIAQKNKKGSLGSYYACSDYKSINPEFGTIDDFKQLVQQAHSMGFKVIIDWVANHTGWDHKWTRQFPDYYLKDTATNDFKIASGMDDIIELDYSNPSMRKAMIAAMKYWITEFDIDGFRCDLAFWVELDFWKQARVELDQLKPLFWLGEFDELENASYGEVFDASYTWTWMHRTKDFYQSKLPLDTLFSVLKSYDDLGDSTMRSWFTANHDENSWNGTEFEKYGDMAKSLAAFSMTWNGVPLLYSGQEVGNRKRLAFFEKDPLEKGPDAAELTRFYQSLLRLKHSNAALRAGDPAVTTYRIKTSADDKVFCFLRKRGDQEVLVVLNWSSEKDLHFEILDDRVKGIYRNVFSNAANDFTSSKYFEMQPWESLVYER